MAQKTDILYHLTIFKTNQGAVQKRVVLIKKVNNLRLPPQTAILSFSGIKRTNLELSIYLM